MKKIILITCLFFIIENSFSQQQTKVFDTGIWTGIGINYIFKKDFKISASQDLRLSEAFTKISKANSDLGFQYKINKNFKLGTKARYSYNLRKSSFYSHDFRMNYDLMFKVKLIQNLKLRYRLRFQQVYENLFTSKRYQVGSTTSNLRNKLQFDYTIKEHRIYVSTELFREMKLYKTPYFNKIRIVLGDQWENKLGNLNFAIAYERDLGVEHPLNYLFFRTYYTFEFEKKNNNKKQKRKAAKNEK